MKDYNIGWFGQSTSSADSMPLGGYDVGCNVWTENNRIYLYLSQSGAFDENGTLLKLCRLSLEPDAALMQAGVRQTLLLEDGCIRVEIGSEDRKQIFDLWCCVDKPELHIEWHGAESPVTLRAECWRWRDRQVTPAEVHQCRDYQKSPMLAEGRILTTADVFEPADGGMFLFHRNPAEDILLDRLIEEQQAEAFRDAVYRPLENRISGCHIRCEGMRYLGSEPETYRHTDCISYRYALPVLSRGGITVSMLTAQLPSVEVWKQQIAEAEAIPADPEKTKRWWHDFFEKSYIRVDESHPGSEAWKIGRNYQMFRYMLGCNYYGSWPTKFNGGLFTFDDTYTPDFRMWSGTGYTAQNQRLVYWPMLKAGDFDAMKPQFDLYKHISPVSLARTKHFYGHGGAYYFEQGNVYGLCNGSAYNWKHAPDVTAAEVDNAWVKFHYSSGLEFALMILEYHRYTGEDIEDYLPFVESTVEFYAQHYPRTPEGKLLIYPGSALETYRGVLYSRMDAEYACVNPTDAVAGLRCVSRYLAQYYADDPEKQAHFAEIFDACPEIATAADLDGRYYTPAQTFNPTPFNCELPQLYPVFPYSPFGLSEEEKELGRNAYGRKYPSADQYLGFSWHQNGIFAARLGLTEEAFRYLKMKLLDADRRFPAFWGPGHDWMPDHNHGGSGMIMLQEMVIQLDGDEPVFLPAWDRTIDVSFRLHLPGNRIAEFELKNGKVVYQHILNDPKTAV